MSALAILYLFYNIHLKEKENACLKFFRVWNTHRCVSLEESVFEGRDSPFEQMCFETAKWNFKTSVVQTELQTGQSWHLFHPVVVADEDGVKLATNEIKRKITVIMSIVFIYLFFAVLLCDHYYFEAPDPLLYHLNSDF